MVTAAMTVVTARGNDRDIERPFGVDMKLGLLVHPAANRK
jgi:hypothetical protein